MILVTGAAGKTGQAIIRALVEREESVRAFVYRPKQGTIVKRSGADEVVIGNMCDKNAFQSAIRGVRSLYHICPNMNPYEVEIAHLALAEFI